MLVMFVGGRRRRLVTIAYALKVYDLLLGVLQQGRQAVMAAAAGHNQHALQPVGAQNVPVVLHARPIAQEKP